MKLRIQGQSILTIGIVILGTLCCAGCGRKGPLVPPEGLVPAAVTDLSARQKGERLLLSWTPPDRAVGGGALRETPGSTLFRRPVPSPAEDCERCTSGYQVVKTILPGGAVGNRQIPGKVQVDDPDAAVGSTYRYYVISFLQDRVASPPSNQVVRKVSSPPPPPVLSPAEGGAGIELTWQPASAPAGSEISGYNIYRRRENGQFPEVPLNSSPVRETRYEDLAVEPEVPYHYAVRTVGAMEGNEVESVLSNEVTGIFRPDAQLR